MTVFYHNEMGLCLVKLNGPLLRSQAEEIIETFRTLSGQGIKRVVVDLTEVPFVDGRGLAALLAGYQWFGSQAQNFRLAGLQDQPRLVCHLTGFDYIFQIFESVAEAVADEVVEQPSLEQLPGYLQPSLQLTSMIQPAMLDTIW